MPEGTDGLLRWRIPPNPGKAISARNGAFFSSQTDFEASPGPRGAVRPGDVVGLAGPLARARRLRSRLVRASHGDDPTSSRLHLLAPLCGHTAIDHLDLYRVDDPPS